MKIWTDGSGNGKYAYVTETEIVRSFDKSDITNNEAEYLAVIKTLEENHENQIEILSDSELMVNQLNHKYSIKNNRLRELALQVWKLAEGRKVTCRWVPRENNKAGKFLG
jgi:ribonuclease HI